MKKLLLVLTLILFVVLINCDTITFASNPPEEPPLYSSATLTIKSRMYSENGTPVDGEAAIEIIEDGSTTETYTYPGEGNTWTYTTDILTDIRYTMPDYEWRSWVLRNGDTQSTHIRTHFTGDDTHVHIYGW